MENINSANGGQQSFTFDAETLIKISKGAVIAGLGAGLIFLLQGVAGMDFGVYTPIAVALSSIAINAIREYIRGQ
jgi:hypothetical protein